MPVIIITGHADIDSAVTAMKEGAVDFIQKPFSRQDLLVALDAAWTELNHPAPSQDERLRAESMIAQLTPREHDVLDGLVKGHPNKVIAFNLDISPRTVELYRANAMRKLNARSLSEMLHVAFLAGMNGR
jgi:two-component system response regulator FixJ